MKKQYEYDSWEDWATDKYGSLEEARRVRSEAGKKGAGVSKRSHLSGNSKKAAEIGKLGANARYGK
jgi:hypothetical protein